MFLTKAKSAVIVLWTYTFIMLIFFACDQHLRVSWGSTEDQSHHCPVAFTSEYGLAISDLILDVFISVSAPANLQSSIVYLPKGAKV